MICKEPALPRRVRLLGTNQQLAMVAEVSEVEAKVKAEAGVRSARSKRSMISDFECKAQVVVTSC